ncbi:MAG: YezD family protein [Betaproteobacteria bacterium]|nr:YezD family protein [Betaproteobacteria bacterium]
MSVNAVEGEIRATDPLDARAGRGPADSASALREISRLLAGLRFGSIEVVVHEGRVTQIERRERVRIPDGPGATGR